MGWGGLFDYSVKPGPDLSRLRLSLVQLVTTRSIKARFGQVGDQVSQVEDQVVKARARSLTILIYLILIRKKGLPLNLNNQPTVTVPLKITFITPPPVCD